MGRLQRKGRRRRAAGPCVLLLTVFLLAPAAPLLAAGPYLGRSVAEVLREFESRGLVLIYNDELVPPSLKVAREPRATGGMPLLAELLASVGLALQPAGPGAWAVVPRPVTPLPVPATPIATSRGAEEVVVSASRYRLAEDQTLPRHFLTREQLEALPTIADDALRAVQRLPGAAGNGISGLAHIRGGELNETRLVLDGLPLYDPFHLRSLLGPVSVLDPRIVGTVDVFTGGQPLAYGDRLSAVVDVRSVEPPAGGYYELGLSLFHTGGLAAGDFAGERGRWLLAGRRSNLDEVAEVADSDVGEASYFDLFGRLSYDFTDRTRAALRLLVARDEAEANDSARTEFSDLSYRNVYVWGSLEHEPAETVVLRALASLTDIGADRFGTVAEPGRRFGELGDRRRYQLGGLRLEAEFDLAGGWYQLGGEANRVEADYWYRSQLEFLPGYPFPADPGRVTVRASDVLPRGRQAAAWLQGRWPLGPRLTGEAGLRWDQQTYTGPGRDSQVGPRLGLLYRLRDGTDLRAVWGRYHQAQGINELQVEDGRDEFTRAQRVDHLVLALEQALPGGISLRVEAYQKDYDSPRSRYENLLDPLVLLPELEADRILIAPDTARARGVEVFLNAPRTGDWSWWAGYVLSRVEDTEAGQRIVRSWDQRHSVTAGVSWTRGPWDLTVAGTWRQGWPTTPAALVDGAAPDIPPDVVFGARNSARLRSFRSLDARLNRRFEVPGGELTAFIEVINLVNFRNDCCVEFSVSQAGDAWLLSADRDQWLGPVPNLGVLWRFGTRE